MYKMLIFIYKTIFYYLINKNTKILKEIYIIQNFKYFYYRFIN